MKICSNCHHKIAWIGHTCFEKDCNCNCSDYGYINDDSYKEKEKNLACPNCKKYQKTLIKIEQAVDEYLNDVESDNKKGRKK